MPEQNDPMYGGYPQQQMPMQQMPQGMPPQPPYGGGFDGGYPQQQYPGYGMPPQPPQKKGLGTGAIIGIIAGVAVLGLGIGFFLLRGNGNDTPSDDGKPATVTTRTGDSDEKDGDKPSSSGDETQTGTGEDGTETGSGTEGTDPSAVGTDPATPAVTPSPAPAASDWLSGEFVLEGQTYTLLKSGFRDLEANGWVISEDTQKALDAQYGGTIIVNPNIDIIGSGFDLETATKQGVSINVTNLTNEAKDFKDCSLASIQIDGRTYSSDPKTPPSITVAGGGMLGMTVAEIKAIYGEPTDIYPTDEDPNTSIYASLSYRPENSYDQELTFRFSDGKVDEIEFQLA